MDFLRPTFSERIIDPVEGIRARLDSFSIGIGLTIANDYVKRHGGNIRVESEPGEGAAFIVEFPVI